MKNKFIFFKIATTINFICSAFLIPAMYLPILKQDHSYLLYPSIEPSFIAIVFYVNFLIFLLSGFNFFLIFNSFFNYEKKAFALIFSIMFSVNMVSFFGQIIYTMFMNTPIDTP